MASKTSYNTRQREVILEHISAMPGAHFTVRDICQCLKEKGSPIGTTTVYRQLERMVAEGLVSKYIVDSNTPACFEYTGPSHVRIREEVCFHCKCEVCGRLIHMHCDELEGIREHMLKHHSFSLNPLRTVFYGLCSDCMNASLPE